MKSLADVEEEITNWKKAGAGTLQAIISAWNKCYEYLEKNPQLNQENEKMQKKPNDSSFLNNINGNPDFGNDFSNSKSEDDKENNNVIESKDKILPITSQVHALADVGESFNYNEKIVLSALEINSDDNPRALPESWLADRDKSLPKLPVNKEKTVKDNNNHKRNTIHRNRRVGENNQLECENDTNEQGMNNINTIKNISHYLSISSSNDLEQNKKPLNKDKEIENSIK
jgi:hypothetical protein